MSINLHCQWLSMSETSIMCRSTGKKSPQQRQLEYNCLQRFLLVGNHTIWISSCTAAWIATREIGDENGDSDSGDDGGDKDSPIQCFQL